MADERHDWIMSQILRHRRALYRYLLKFSFGAEDTQDLIQETLVRLYSLADYHAVDSPRALLFRVAHDLALERVRRASSPGTDAVADPPPSDACPSEAPAGEQSAAPRAREFSSAAVDRLPPLCRRIFVLRKVHDLSHAEIAEVLNVSHGVIERQVAKGLVRCRDFPREIRLGAADAVDKVTSIRRRSDRGDNE